eukprot:gene10893-12106_t
MVSDAATKENEEERGGQVDDDKGEWKTQQPPAGQRSVLEVTLLGQITADKYWNILLPSASSFFSGLELLPMACRDAKEPRKTLPRAMQWSFGLIAMNALLLIITVGCNDPGSSFIAYNDTNPLYYGFS